MFSWKIGKGREEQDLRRKRKRLEEVVGGEWDDHLIWVLQAGELLLKLRESLRRARSRSGELHVVLALVRLLRGKEVRQG